MNILLFAGGSGTRLWPLSRKNSPKQFEKILGDQSTLQLAVERVAEFGFENIFIATNEKYADIVASQVPQISTNNVMLEPAKRDLAAAVGLALVRLKKQGLSGPLAILWSDHLMSKPENFVAALKSAEARVEVHLNQLVFLAEQPRFANQNLGWIHVGDEQDKGEFSFLGWKYKPEKSVCDEMFRAGEWCWNPGYFVFDIEHMLELYAKHKPEMLNSLQNMVEDEQLLAEQYATLESTSFDQAIIEEVDPPDAVVMKVDLGWSDPGTLYALKEAFVSDQEKNHEQGNVVAVRTKDSLIYNEEETKTVCTLGLEGMIVVNTKDAVFVCHKDEVANIKELLAKLEEEKKGELL